MNKGFAPLVVIILAAAIIGGGAYYLTKRNGRRPQAVQTGLPDNGSEIAASRNTEASHNGVSDDGKEYHFSCSEKSEYVKAFCDGKSADAIISTNDYPGGSNADFKSRLFVQYTVKLIAADKELNAEYQKALSYFDKDIELFSKPEYDGDTSSGYHHDQLVKAKNTFIDAERAWINLWNKDCQVRIASIPPIAIGTNSLDSFEMLNCDLEYLTNRAKTLKIVNGWLDPQALGKD